MLEQTKKGLKAGFLIFPILLTGCSGSSGAMVSVEEGLQLLAAENRVSYETTRVKEELLESEDGLVTTVVVSQTHTQTCRRGDTLYDFSEIQEYFGYQGNIQLDASLAEMYLYFPESQMVYVSEEEDQEHPETYSFSLQETTADTLDLEDQMRYILLDWTSGTIGGSVSGQGHLELEEDHYEWSWSDDHRQLTGTLKATSLLDETFEAYYQAKFEDAWTLDPSRILTFCFAEDGSLISVENVESCRVSVGGKQYPLTWSSRIDFDQNYFDDSLFDLFDAKAQENAQSFVVRPEF